MVSPASSSPITSRSSAASPWASTSSTPSPSRFGNSEIPFWERFYMGGERDIRGYEIYTIGPRDENGTSWAA